MSARRRHFGAQPTLAAALSAKMRGAKLSKRTQQAKRSGSLTVAKTAVFRRFLLFYQRFLDFLGANTLRFEQEGLPWI